MFFKKKKGGEMETLDDLYSQIGKEVKKRGIDAAIIIPVRDTLRELDGLGCAYRLIVGGKPTVGSYRAMVLARVVAIFFAAGSRARQTFHTEAESAMGRKTIVSFR
jgi:hypothetical protein